MDKLEKAEKIREKTGVSYEDAKAALEANSDDILDAIVWLEAQGKIPTPEQATYSTKQESHSEAFSQAQQAYEADCSKKSSGDTLRRIGRWLSKLLKKSCDTSFEVTRLGRQILSVPVLVLILCVILAFWITVPLLVVGLFLDCSYRFKGFKSTSIDINDMCDKASETCEQLKRDFQGEKQDN